MPVLYSKSARAEYIRHIIDTESEAQFLRALREYTRKSDNLLRKLDWWMFCKLDQYLDSPHIPYYDPKENRIARFIPDFIFWAQKGSEYTICFVDPKGAELIDWQRKVDGYRSLFESPAGKTKGFTQDETNVRLMLALFTKDRNELPDNEHKRFYFDSIASLVSDNFIR